MRKESAGLLEAIPGLEPATKKANTAERQSLAAIYIAAVPKMRTLMSTFNANTLKKNVLSKF